MHPLDAGDTVPKQDSINKPEFAARIQRELSVSLEVAEKLYDSMVHVFEDAVVTGSKVKIGHVGVIVPKRRPPREIRMGFEVAKGHRIKKVTRIYNLDSRLDFRFRIYRAFINSRSLQWFDSHEETPPD